MNNSAMTQFTFQTHIIHSLAGSYLILLRSHAKSEAMFSICVSRPFSTCFTCSFQPSHAAG